MLIDTIVISARDFANSGDGDCHSARLRGFRMETLKVCDGNESNVHTYDDNSPIDPWAIVPLFTPRNIVGNAVRISIPPR